MVYKGLQSSFVSLAWPWSGRSLPKREWVGVLGPWTGVQCGWAPSSPTINFVTNLKSNRLTFVHMAGSLANCSWLTGYLSMSTWPSSWERHLVAKCDTTALLDQVDLWSDVPQAETSCGQVWYYFRSGWAVYWRVNLVPAAMVIPPPLFILKLQFKSLFWCYLFRQQI